MKLTTLATPMTTANLNAVLKQLAECGCTVKATSPIIRTAYNQDGVKILSAARPQPRGNWHVMSAPGLLNAKQRVLS